MIHARRFAIPGTVVLALVVVAAGSRPARAQVYGNRFYARWSRRSTSEVREKLKRVRKEAVRDYRSYLSKARRAHRNAGKRAPGNRNNSRLRRVVEAYREYQNDLMEQRLLLLILRQR